ncbi:hypothetical protein STAS_19619 [Striga asiatica]|uniref:CP12 domain-containing protein n=1 Tax=Striga asiatica TaxID=4170 RepID=A0A5A7QCM1_STRAF|nr:hypothetical protein STAS_19619 [Striga asiatica]
MAAVAGVSITSPKFFIAASSSSKPGPIKLSVLNTPWRNSSAAQIRRMRATAAAPEQISEKVVESIKSAEEACSEDPKSGECAAAWDEVEELSAAASHARDRQKEADPLENYCKDNPETDECRTYDN